MNQGLGNNLGFWHRLVSERKSHHWKINCSAPYSSGPNCLELQTISVASIPFSSFPSHLLWLFYLSTIMNASAGAFNHGFLGRRRQTNPHLAHSYVWIAFCAEIEVNMFSDIKRKPDTLSIRRLTLAVILSLGFSRTFNRLCQKGQLLMNWHQHLVVI